MDSWAHLLVADIGGTHSRFAHCSGMGRAVRWHQVVVCPTAHLHSTEDALAQASATGLAAQDADAVVWGVAGPVHGNRACVTNADLELDFSALSAASGGRAQLINDFAAQAWATYTEAGLEAVEILPGGAVDDGLRSSQRVHAVIGAGTGLGMASRVPWIQSNDSSRWRCLSSEGGHAALPLYGRQEEALRDFILTAVDAPYVSAEHVLSGRGLCLVHHFLTGKDWPVERVSAEGLTPGSPTLRLYARLYGRMCRHWALQTLCTGGLFVTGGVAVKNPQIVRCADFAEEFYNCPPMEALLRTISVQLMTMEHAGLWGAASAAMEWLRSDG